MIWEYILAGALAVSAALNIAMGIRLVVYSHQAARQRR